jgi:hypothetical protein
MLSKSHETLPLIQMFFFNDQVTTFQPMDYQPIEKKRYNLDIFFAGFVV